jgi:acetolactate synthase-1/2/3 large subunit
MSTPSSADATRTMTGGQAMVEALVDHGVDTVFGIPGIQLDPLFDAFHARRNQIRMVHTRHEQGAAFMAMGYAQSSERTGVFAVVPGPGLLNGMAAVSTAVAASTPVLGITGQIPSYQIGMGYGLAHELRDQLAMSEGVVDWARRANHPTEVPSLIGEAFAFMHAGRKKPAILEMAPDQLAAAAPVRFPAPSARPVPNPDPERISEMAQRLMRAERPAIFIGGGAYGAERALRELAERIEAPVIVSPSGLGAFPDDHRLAFGILAGQDIWEQVDVALVVGTRFISTALSWGREGEVEVLRIDADPVQIGKPRPASVSVVTTAAAGLQALLATIGAGPAPRRAAYLEGCEQARAAMNSKLESVGQLPAMARALRAALPRDGILVTDVNQLAYMTRFGGYPVYEPKTWLGPGYQATLGYGLPAALGAKIANPERKVVALCGDGGFMFTVQELATAVHHQIPVVVVVVDNASYGNVKTIQAQSYGGRHIAVELTNPDFVALARSFGMEAEQARTAEQLEDALSRLLPVERPSLISVPMGEVPSIWDFVRRPPSQGEVSG